MKKALLIVLIIAFQLNVVVAQKASIESMKGLIEARYRVSLDSVDLCDIYILEGEVYDEKSINSALRNYKKQQIIFTELVDLSKTTFFNRDCKYVTVLSTGSNQTEEEKERILSKVRANLNDNLPKLVIRDYVCQDCMQVVVDGMPIRVYQARQLVNDIKKEDIQNIAMYDTPNPEVYGSNAKNGLVEIYLKNKKKSR
ncbi:hypothetical protein [uncultured Pontibacter sp.]|uniref:hypothetical protein n=1 Tax=uncultured Pontibacter sp. TaxID=453356 RepID=UPI00262F0A6F|nr:hypothetical protein [uncultured Pontibacter sp.]